MSKYWRHVNSIITAQMKRVLYEKESVSSIFFGELDTCVNRVNYNHESG